ncbi:unnamed protein product [Rotaria sp. Silwood2]|nr:unnamed protein product [Rotaria sp. Silwood2]
MISTLDLRTAYENVDAVRDFCRKLMAIALMPMDDVEDAYLENQEWISVIGKEMYSVYNLAWLTNNNCEYALHSTKYYKDRPYPTLPKTLDNIIKQWISTVHCPVGEKVYYNKISDNGTRTYFSERVKGSKPILKVVIQSNDKKKSKNAGTFEVLSCQEEFCKVLNDAVKTLEDTGSPLEAASYYQKISNKFDVGRDRSKYVLK